MEKSSIGFLLLALAALLLAGFLTWNLLNPKQVSGFYEETVGSLPHAPSDRASAKAIIYFKKTERDEE